MAGRKKKEFTGKAKKKESSGEKKKAIREKRKSTISKISLSSASKKDIQRERNRVYQLRYRLNKRIDKADTKTKKRELRNELIKTSRYLSKLREVTGSKVKKRRRVKDEEYIISDAVRVEIVKKWEVMDAVETLINSGYFKKFIVGGAQIPVDLVEEILLTVDALITEADNMVPPAYAMRITQNFNQEKLTISIIE